MIHMEPLQAVLSPSRHLDQVLLARQTYQAIADDNLLHGFRREAGQPASGNAMGGWCSHNSSVIFGQIISGLARMGHHCGDSHATNKAVRLFELWRQTAGADGDARMGTYGWDKLIGGIVDLEIYGGYSDARKFLEQTTHWASRSFDRNRTPASALDWDGRHPNGALEWYTLGENLYRASALTHSAQYRDFADVWQYPAFWNKFAHTDCPSDAHSVHAYSHVNSLCSLAAAYETHDDPAMLQTLRNASQYLLSTQCFATGGYGPWERLLAPNGQLGRSLELCSDHAEVCCGSWAAFKLGTYLLRFTGQVCWADWIERVLHNLIGAALPVMGDGRTYYYADYRASGGHRAYFDSAWPCCSGTYLQALSAYHDLIYFTGADHSLYVLQYLPSELRHTVNQQTLTLRQEGQFPVTDTMQLRISCATPMALTLRLRIPGWCSNAAVTVGDHTLTSPAGTWLEICSTWADGDSVEIKLPQQFRFEPVDGFHPHCGAVTRGPLTFAQNGRYCRPLLLDSPEELNDRAEQREKPLWFWMKDAVKHDLDTAWFRPFYDFPENSVCRVYHNVKTPFLY